MADIPGRPAGASTVPQPVGLPPEAGAGSEPYRPLSLLALMAFVLGAGYAGLVVLGGVAGFASRHSRLFGLLLLAAVLLGPLLAVLRRDRRSGRMLTGSLWAIGVLLTILGLGGLIAYSGSSPWQLPGTLWPMPLAAIVLAWLAGSRIRASEGTLSGTALARWGLGLSLFFGLNYAAYTLSNNLALVQQSSQATEEFLELIQKGDLQQAFLRTLPQRSRPSAGADVRRILEVEHNVARGPQDAGPWATFTRTNYVRLIELGGAETTWTLTSNEPATFDRGSSHLTLLYDLVSPLGKFTLQVVTTGQETIDETGGLRRRWHIDLPGTQLVGFGETSAQRKVLDVAKRVAHDASRVWLESLRDGNVDYAYLKTLPTTQRHLQARGSLLDAPAVAVLTGVGSMGAFAAGREGQQAYAAGRKRFRTAALLDSGDFWADDSVRGPILREVRALFAGTPSLVRDASPLPIDVPRYRVEGNEIHLRIPARLMMADNTRPLYQAEAEIELVGPATGDRLVPEQFRVVKLHLIRGQTAVDPKAGPRG